MQLTKLVFVLVVVASIDEVFGRGSRPSGGYGPRPGGSSYPPGSLPDKHRPRKPTKLDLCGQKDYLQQNITDCLCNCTDKCPSYSDLKASSCNVEQMARACNIGKGKPKQPIFDVAMCIAKNMMNCIYKDFSGCGSCINNCVDADTAKAIRKTMKQKETCLSNCANSGDCSKEKYKSTACKTCKDQCTPPSPPPA